MAVLTVTSDTFEEEVLKEKGPVFVDFWATWCGPCQSVAPLVEEISEEVDGVKFCKVDVDQNPDLTQTYKIFSIPTFLVFKDGEVKKSGVGALPKDELMDLLNG